MEQIVRGRETEGKEGGVRERLSERASEREGAGGREEGREGGMVGGRGRVKVREFRV